MNLITKKFEKKFSNMFVTWRHRQRLNHHMWCMGRKILPRYSPLLVWIPSILPVQRNSVGYNEWENSDNQMGQFTVFRIVTLLSQHGFPKDLALLLAWGTSPLCIPRSISSSSTNKRIILEKKSSRNRKGKRINLFLRAPFSISSLIFSLEGG